MILTQADIAAIHDLSNCEAMSIFPSRKHQSYMEIDQTANVDAFATLLSRPNMSRMEIDQMIGECCTVTVGI